MPGSFRFKRSEATIISINMKRYLDLYVTACPKILLPVIMQADHYRKEIWSRRQILSDEAFHYY